MLMVDRGRMQGYSLSRELLFLCALAIDDLSR